MYGIYANIGDILMVNVPYMAYMDRMGKSTNIGMIIGIQRNYHTDHNGNRIIFVPGMLMAGISGNLVGGIKRPTELSSKSDS